MTLPTWRRRIVVVGSLNMDLIIRVPRLPAAGETVGGGADLVTAPGGKGANQAVAASRLGASVSMLGRVGDDAFGSSLVDVLRDESVDTSYVQRTEGATGVALITVDEAGENTIALASGANRRLSVADVDAAWGRIAESDVCIAQLEVPVEVVIEAFRRARAAGATTILNAAPARPLPAELLEHTTVCILNTVELDQLVGRASGSLAERARGLFRHGISVVIVTQGAHETLAVTAGGTCLEVKPPRVTPVDTVGAGDAFVGAFAALHDSLDAVDLNTALHRANVAGALATQQQGAQSSLPTRDDLVRWLAET